MTVWLREDKEGFLLTAYIQPGARQTGIAGLHGDALKIRLAAAPVDGKANAALIDFLSKWMDLPQSRIQIVGGVRSRTKRIRIHAGGADLPSRIDLSGV